MDVALCFCSLLLTHHSLCRSSQLLARSSSTVHERPCALVCSGVLSSFLSEKKSHSPWSGSTSTGGSSRLGSGMGLSVFVLCLCGLVCWCGVSLWRRQRL